MVIIVGILLKLKILWICICFSNKFRNVCSEIIEFCYVLFANYKKFEDVNSGKS